MCNHQASDIPATYGEADMQQNHIIIKLFNMAGESLGSMTLPASIKLVDLAALKALGAVRAVVAK